MKKQKKLSLVVFLAVLIFASFFTDNLILKATKVQAEENKVIADPASVVLNMTDKKTARVRIRTNRKLSNSRISYLYDNDIVSNDIEWMMEEGDPADTYCNVYITAKTSGKTVLAITVGEYNTQVSNYVVFGRVNIPITVVGQNGKVDNDDDDEDSYVPSKNQKKSTSSKKKTSSKAAAKVTVKKMQLKTVKSDSSNTMKIVWKKLKKVTGYQVQISSKRNFKSQTIQRMFKAKQSRTTLRPLTSKRKYYVRVRAYKKSGKKKIYGAWSQIKKVKIK